MDISKTIELAVPILWIQTIEPDSLLAEHGFGGTDSGRLMYLGRNHIVLYSGATYGPARIALSSMHHAPEPSLGRWETVEEGTIDVTGTLTLVPHPVGTETNVADIVGTTAVDGVTPGRWHVRAHASGRAVDRADVSVLVQFWPADRAVPLTTLKVGDDFLPHSLTTTVTQPPPKSNPFDLPRDRSLLIRTEFSDDDAWSATVDAASVPWNLDGDVEICADLAAIDNVAFAEHTVHELRAVLGNPPPYFFFVADRETIMNPDHPILAVDHSNDESGTPTVKTVRVAPEHLAEAENNLSLGNMDFADFADSADADGVYRGF